MERLQTAWDRVRLAGALWRRGAWEALQLQRCVVFFVLDDSGRVLAQTARCALVNGVLYLGSIALHAHATRPAAAWLLARGAAPAAAAAWLRVLDGAFALLWLAPLYAVSLGVSCAWYQQIAAAAYEVRQKQQRQQRQQQQVSHGDGAGGGSGGCTTAAGTATPSSAASGGGGGGGGGAPADGSGGSGAAAASSSSSLTAPAPAAAAAAASPLGGAAEELFRVLLFVVFTVEVAVVGALPVVGRPLYVLLLAWLYAFYCFDYGAALRGAPLAARLRTFESQWALQLGFGFPCAAATALLPFHAGAAAANLLFALFVLVAAGCDPDAAQREVAGAAAGAAPLGAAPVFVLALRPTAWLVRRVFGRFNNPGGGGGAAASGRVKQA